MSLAHKDDMFETPQWIITDIVRTTKKYIELDLCASDDNSKAVTYINEEMNALNRMGNPKSWEYYPKDEIIFCNPPRSKNGKFVELVYYIWKECHINVAMLLCWNDLGNKYGEKLIPHILNGDIKVYNLGKVKFNKNGKESEYVSRLTYFWAWFKV